LPHSGARSLPNKTGYGLTKENTTKKQTYATSQEMIDDLKGWMVRYDFYRPHRQLGRKTPYEADCDSRIKWRFFSLSLGAGHGMRPYLRFLATARPAQRQAATGPDGLAFTKMTLAQQQQFIALLSSGPGGRPPGGQPGGPAPTLEELAGTALRVDYAQAGSYEWRRPQGDQPAVSVREARGGRPSLPLPAMFEPAPVRERTREAALQAARRVDPGATEAQITTPAQPGLLVQIMTSGPEGRNGGR
jgi:hypothetical protein